MEASAAFLVEAGEVGCGLIAYSARFEWAVSIPFKCTDPLMAGLGSHEPLVSFECLRRST